MGFMAKGESGRENLLIHYILIIFECEIKKSEKGEYC